VTTFRLACSRNYTAPDGERKEETEWFSVVTWSKLAETCSQFLQKGRRAYVEGRLQTRSWESADGQRRFRTEVIANTVLFLDRAQAAPMPEESAPATEAGEQVDPDDLPFE
jgi:single-strand DNA-binding protein